MCIRDRATLVGIGKIRCFIVKCRQGADHADHHGHRMSVTAETLVELDHLLMDRHVPSDGKLETLFLSDVRQFAVFQQMGHLEKVALFGELLDRVTAIEELALVTVEEGDLRLATRGRLEARIVGKATRSGAKGTNCLLYTSRCV